MIKQVKTRKDSKCAYCGAFIPRGTVSFVRSWTDNLVWYSARFCCEKCAEAH